jgi:hypothetical protein
LSFPAERSEGKGTQEGELAESERKFFKMEAVVSLWVPFPPIGRDAAGARRE